MRVGYTFAQEGGSDSSLIRGAFLRGGGGRMLSWRIYSWGEKDFPQKGG